MSHQSTMLRCNKELNTLSLFKIIKECYNTLFFMPNNLIKHAAQHIVNTN